MKTLVRFLRRVGLLRVRTDAVGNPIGFGVQRVGGARLRAKDLETILRSSPNTSVGTFEAAIRGQL